MDLVIENLRVEHSVACLPKKPDLPTALVGFLDDAIVQAFKVPYGRALVCAHRITVVLVL